MYKLPPLEQYREDIAGGNIMSDAGQLQAVEVLQTLYNEIEKKSYRKINILHFLKGMFFKDRPHLKGIYLWGGVGTGKTYLADCFFESLPLTGKLRIHFHRFMQRVHHELSILKNVENPLQIVADNFALEYQVICFDEFHVSDITDAMILGGLLQAFFNRGIVFVTTSNEHPDDLYRNGLQRSRFLPAIEEIKAHTQIVKVDSGIDYRLRYLDGAEIYHYPLDENARQMLTRNLEHLAPNFGRADRTIEIENRKIQTVHCADGVVWFDFDVICNSPRSAADFIEIARQFQTVLIENVPCMTEEMNDQAKRFITLVDEFYDRNVKLIMTAAVPIEELYTGTRLQFEFGRTRSRLIEMQSRDYLGRQHLSD